jgi:hypothetical protein
VPGLDADFTTLSFQNLSHTLDPFSIPLVLLSYMPLVYSVKSTRTWDGSEFVLQEWSEGRLFELFNP